MTELLTAAQMKAIETAAISAGEVTGLELMERAGRGVVEAVFEEWPTLAAAPHRAVVLCGPGNNGGDGFVVARLLKEWGWEVEVFLYGDADKLPPDAKVNYQRWRGMGEILQFTFPNLTDVDEDQFITSAFSVSGTKLIVDALFGIGLTRGISGLIPILTKIDMYATFDDLMPSKVVSIDIPSGVSSDTGEIFPSESFGILPWDAVQADLTVTFHAKKMGHCKGQGVVFCGNVVVKDIGLCKWAEIALPEA